MNFFLQPLTLLTFLPLVGNPSCFFIPSSAKKLLRWVALGKHRLWLFAASLWVLGMFDASNPDLQLKAQYEWDHRGEWNIQYYLGIDGLEHSARPAHRVPDADSILSTWTAIERSRQGFHDLFPVARSGYDGRLPCAGFIPVLFFWEFTLVPMYS